MGAWRRRNYERTGALQEKLLRLQAEIGERQREMLRVVAELDSLEAYDADGCDDMARWHPRRHPVRAGR